MPHLQDTHTHTHTVHALRAHGIRKTDIPDFFYLFWDFFNVF